jgi:hypothetical protein
LAESAGGTTRYIEQPAKMKWYLTIPCLIILFYRTQHMAKQVQHLVYLRQMEVFLALLNLPDDGKGNPCFFRYYMYLHIF